MSSTPERLRQMRKEDPERFARYERTKRERHRAKLDAASKLRKVRWRAENPEKARAAYKRENARRPKGLSTLRYREDPAFNLLCRLRTRTRKAFDGRSKTAATRALIGCSCEELRAWVELWFAEDMTWDNMAEWELDHHWPLSAFDLADPRHIAKAFHYTNLRPLWRSENRSKKDRMRPNDRAAFEAWRASLA